MNEVITIKAQTLNKRSELPITEQVYKELCEQIVSLQLLPNQLLLVQTLAISMKVNRSAIREALIRLREEGLVYPGSGNKFYVASLDQKSVNDYFEARMLMEVYCARYLAEKAEKADQPDSFFEPLYQSLLNFEKAVTNGDDALRLSTDYEFHRMMLILTNNSVLSHWMDMSSNVYRRIRVALYNKSKLSTLVQEHRSIYNAIHNGDADAAEAAVRLHINNTIKNSSEAAILFLNS